MADDHRLSSPLPNDDKLPVDKPPNKDGDDTVHGVIPKPNGEQ